MKAQWEKLAQNFQARNRRERTVIAAMLLLVVAAFFYLLLLEPALRQRHTLQKQIAELRTQTATDSEQVRALTQRLQDPDAGVRTQIQNLRSEIGAVDTRLQALQRALAPPTRMAALLEQILKDNSRLHLVEMHKLPVTTLADPTQSPSAEKPAKLGVYKHGMEITVQGQYADLYDYLKALEQLPQQLYWGEVKLVTETWPRNRMTIVVYTLSLDEAWLTL
ncbi:MAG: hypothetical protein EPO06_00995 [Burkholderiaceae bacterium]|nr:MAG: hypothetical protein EPO06_00995 [Burkholderiaceae bacterium]